MSERPPTLRPVTRLAAGQDVCPSSTAPEADAVADERPLELVVDGEPLVVLLRTPGSLDDDRALAAGFLLSEGLVTSAHDLTAIEPCRDPRSEGNRLHLTPARGVVIPSSARRAFASTAACGLCGKSAIAALAVPIADRPPRAPLALATVLAMAERVAASQREFRLTGSVHAAALFAGAELIDVREDVGRHNAVDKVLGHRLLDGDPLPMVGRTLWVSGRVSFELVQKALVAGLDGLVAVGGPTALAVDLAVAHDLTLVGFCRGTRANLYAGRVTP